MTVPGGCQELFSSSSLYSWNSLGEERVASVFMGHTWGGSLTLIFSEESINMALDTACILPPEFRIEGYFLHISKGEFAFFNSYFLTVKEKKNRDFPGGSVVKILPSNAGVCECDSWLGG